MAGDAEAGIFVRIDGIKGDSIERGHEDWIDALAFGIQGGRAQTTGGGGQGIVFGEFVIVKSPDRATPDLLQAVTQRTILPRVDIEVCLRGAIRVCFLSYELRTVIVTSVAPGIVETVTLGFAVMTQTFTETLGDGRAGNSISRQVDLAQIGGSLAAFDPPTGGFSVGDGPALFLRAFDIDGGAADQDHVGWSAVETLEGGTVALTQGVGVSALTVTKPVDKASPKLLEAVVKGTKGTVRIDMCRVLGGSLGCDLQYTLDDAVLSHISTAGARESLTIEFGMITQVFTFRDAFGQVRGTKTFSFNLGTGK